MTHDYESDNPAACARLERDLAGFLDGTLDESRSQWVTDHLTLCGRCAALLDALDAPGAVGAVLAARPAMRAPAGLWEGVARRIEAPVVELSPARAARDERLVRQLRGSRWLRSGVAAAALVAVTAGVTYELTLRRGGSVAPESVASGSSVTPSAAPGGAPSAAPSTTTVASAAPEQTGTLAPNGVASAGMNGGASETGPAVSTVSNGGARGTSARGTSARGVRSVARGPLPEEVARDTYDREIGKLRGILAERGSQLDTSTVRVLTESMQVIDRAIAQSRAALARDPASGFLNQQLNKALDRKLELLRTAALLPART